MAAAAVIPLISVEQYLHSSYEPDMDYVDGVLEERNLGEIDHGTLQRRLILMLCGLGADWEERVFPETRVQVAPTRFRVPDVCVMPEGWQGDRIIQQAPLLCLDVLSPEDRISRVLKRAKDFLAMGVPEVWIFDPDERQAYRLLPDGVLQEVPDRLELRETEIALDLKRLFRTV